MGNRPVAFIAASRNPFEIFMLVACVASGVGGLANPHRGSQAFADVVPTWELYAWYAGLTLGSVITLIGALGGRIVYMYIERLGLVLLSGMSIGYTLGLVLSVTRPFSLPVLLLGAFALSCVIRLLQVSRELAVAREAQQ